MPKNPFVNCKSRKRRKKRVIVRQVPKGYCPRTMVRYDDSPNEYKTMFVCKMCMTCVLSENALNAHIIRCKEAFKKTEPVKNVEELRYICEVCDKVFSRKVTLEKHREQHNSNGSDLEESDSEKLPIIPRKKPKQTSSELVKYKDDTNNYTTK